MSLPDLSDVYALVERQYDTLTGETEQAREFLIESKSARMAYFASRPRRVSDPAMYCIDRFASAELDFVTPGVRGMGRVSEIVPRFAAKYRDAFASMAFDTKIQFTKAIHDHVACGYLYVDFCYPDAPSDPAKFDNATLFDEWVSLIFSPPKAIEPQTEEDWQLWSMWFAAAGKRIQDIAENSGISWDSRDIPSSDQNIVTKYFDAGTTLRYAEALLTKRGPSAPPLNVARATSSKISTQPKSAPSLNIGWIIAGVLGFIFVIWLCGGGAGVSPDTRTNYQRAIDLQWDEYDAKVNQRGY